MSNQTFFVMTPPGIMDGPYSSQEEAVQFLTQFMTNPSPEMLSMVVIKREGPTLSLVKENGCPLNLAYLIDNRKRY